LRWKIKKSFREIHFLKSRDVFLLSLLILGWWFMFSWRLSIFLTITIRVNFTKLCVSIKAELLQSFSTCVYCMPLRCQHWVEPTKVITLKTKSCRRTVFSNKIHRSLSANKKSQKHMCLKIKISLPTSVRHFPQFVRQKSFSSYSYKKSGENVAQIDHRCQFHPKFDANFFFTKVLCTAFL